MNAFKPHPAAALWPMMASTALQELAGDIAKNGQQFPILLTDDGLVLDGRNRLEACRIAGVEPRFERWASNGVSPTAFVMSLNARRRHLNESQLALIATEALPLLEAEARERQREAGGDRLAPRGAKRSAEDSQQVAKGKASELAAKSVGVSARTVERAKAVVANAAPAEVEKIRSGEKTLNQVERETVNARWDVLFSSKSDDWATPQHIFDELNARWRFTLDVCASKDNAKCPRFFTVEQDGLKQNWEGVCWMNPPYGHEISAWVAKAHAAADAGATVVCLLPARTDTVWWHEHVDPIRRKEARGELELVRGRLKFGDAKNSAPFPSAVVVFLPPETPTLLTATMSGAEWGHWLRSFWSKVDRSTPDGCWLWTAGVDKDGYGKFSPSLPSRNEQIHLRAHRFSLFLATGSLEELVEHRCHEPACVRPEHLVWGNQSSNIVSSVVRGTHRNASFTADEVTAIRRRIAAGESIADVARSLGRSGSTISAIASRRTWAHVQETETTTEAGSQSEKKPRRLSVIEVSP